MSSWSPWRNTGGEREQESETPRPHACQTPGGAGRLPVLSRVKPLNKTLFLPALAVSLLAGPAAALPAARQARPARAPVRVLRPAARRVSRPAAGPKTPLPISRAALEEAKVALEIPDLKSADDVTGVVRALNNLRGVRLAQVDLKTRLAVVDYLPSETGLPRFLEVCRGAGFEATEYRVEDRFPKPVKIKGG